MAGRSGTKLTRPVPTDSPLEAWQPTADERAVDLASEEDAGFSAAEASAPEEGPRPDVLPEMERLPETGENGSAAPEQLNGESVGDLAPAWPEAVAGPSETPANGFAGDQWPQAVEARESVNGESPEAASPFPTRRPLHKRPEPEPTAEEELAKTISFLQRLQVTVRKAEAAAEIPSPAAFGLSVLQAKRMSRRGITPDPFEIGVLPKPWTSPPPPEDNAEPVVFKEETVDPWETPLPAEPVHLTRGHAAWLVLIGGLCFVTLGLVTYLWTRVLPLSRPTVGLRNAAERGAAASAGEADVSDEALNLANLALEAMQQNDLKRASAILAGAQKRGIVLPGLFYQAGLLAFNQGNSEEADDFLDRSIAAHEAVADCWYLRANAAFFTEGPNKAAEDLEESIGAAPFSPRYYFFRAECLRRHGNSAAAIAQFQQALRCRPNSADTELILFKIGLTKLEANTDLIFKTELHDRLAQEPVSGDTLLLAAADAISRNDFAEAADDLRRAALILPPRVFQSRARDYIFQQQATQPEIAAVLKLTLPTTAANPTPTQRPGHVLIDPATRSLAEADPAGW